MTARRSFICTRRKHWILTGLAIIMGMLWSAAPPDGDIARADTVFYFDGTFRSEDWEITLFYTEGKGGAVSGYQHAVAGAPGFHRGIVNTVLEAPPYAVVQGFHACCNAVYRPAIQGTILTLNYDEDSMLFTEGGQGAGPALQQDSLIYIAERFEIHEHEWRHHYIHDLTEEDFHLWDDPTRHPDFSESGSPITFGFNRGNSTYSFSYTTVACIDNWLLELTTEGPPPASIAPEDDLTFRLAVRGPNPFTRATCFCLSLPVEEKVDVAIFDVEGRRVRTLREGTLPGGEYPLVWDGVDDAGRALPGGVYLARLRCVGEIAGHTRTLRLIR